MHSNLLSAGALYEGWVENRLGAVREETVLLYDVCIEPGNSSKVIDPSTLLRFEVFARESGRGSNNTAQ